LPAAPKHGPVQPTIHGRRFWPRCFAGGPKFVRRTWANSPSFERSSRDGVSFQTAGRKPHCGPESRRPSGQASTSAPLGRPATERPCRPVGYFFRAKTKPREKPYQELADPLTRSSAATQVLRVRAKRLPKFFRPTATRVRPARPVAVSRPMAAGKMSSTRARRGGSSRKPVKTGTGPRSPGTRTHFTLDESVPQGPSNMTTNARKGDRLIRRRPISGVKSERRKTAWFPRRPGGPASARPGSTGGLRPCFRPPKKVIAFRAVFLRFAPTEASKPDA